MIVYGVWEQNREGVGDPDTLIELFWDEDAAKRRVAEAPVYNAGSRFAEQAVWFVEEHKIDGTRWQSFTSEELRSIVDAFDVWEGEARSLSGDKALLHAEITAALASRGLEVSLWAELVPLGRGRIHPETGVEADV